MTAGWGLKGTSPQRWSATVGRTPPPAWRGHGVGHRLLEGLVARARVLGLRRLFCLTFEVDFFRAHGFAVIEGTPVPVDVYAELLRSHDDGVAEFLDLERVKPNTLGNTRMLIELG